MFNSLREELNKIALMEDDELDMMDTHEVGGDDGAADDELVDDENFFEEEDDDDIMDDIENGRETPSANEIDNIIESILLSESCCDDDDEDYDDDDDYEDDDEDSLDYTDGVVGDGDEIEGDPDDDYDEVDIGGETNDIHEDIDEDFEEDLDELLEAICGDCHDIYGNDNDIYGDSADMPDDDVPPSPQYQKMNAMRASGREFIDYGNGNYKKFGKVFLDKNIMDNMTVDDDEYDADGEDYDLYSSAGNIYDDDENEEYYGIRDAVKTKKLYGRHSINNINAAKLGDRYGTNEDALDESVATFLANYLDLDD